MPIRVAPPSSLSVGNAPVWVVSNVRSLSAPLAAGYSAPADAPWSIFPTHELHQLLLEAVYLFAVGDTDVVRVFCRRAVLVSTDCVAGGVARSRASQCQCWGLDEDDVAALCHSRRLVAVYPVCFAVQAVPTEYPFAPQRYPFAGIVLEFEQQQQQQQQQQC